MLYTCAADERRRLRALDAHAGHVPARQADEREHVYGRVWEPEEVELLRARQKQGAPLKETAKLLKRSYSCVKSYASDYGILQEGEAAWTRAEDACLMLLARKGTPVAEIEALMGRSTRAIRQRLSRLRLRLSDLRALGPLELPASQVEHA